MKFITRTAQKSLRIINGCITLQRHGYPSVMLSYDAGIGDDLMCTCVLHELRKRGHDKVWMFSNHPKLFQDNADVDVVLPHDPHVKKLAARRGGQLAPLCLVEVVEEGRRHIPPSCHIITHLCKIVGIPGQISVRPYLFLSETEKQRGRIVPNQIAIQSSGFGARYPVVEKEYYPERVQQVAEVIGADYQVIQIGAKSDPALIGAIDLRGKTTLRETAAILNQSLLFVGQVGLLMHLARSVDCRSVIIYGGREHPLQSGYCCNENLYSAISCAPCWRVNSCEFDRECMKQITPDIILDAVRKQIEQHGQPLAVRVEDTCSTALDYLRKPN